MDITNISSAEGAYTINSGNGSSSSQLVTDSTVAGTSTYFNDSMVTFNNDVTRYDECSPDVLTCQIQRYLFLILSPLLIVVATIGNGLSLAVMTRKSLRGTATAVFISSLAVSDTIAVWTALTRHFIKKFNEYDIRQYSEWACRFQRFFLYVSLDSSAWILAAVAIERFLAVCLPQRHRVLTKKSTSRPFQMVAAIVVFMCVFNSNVFFTYGEMTVLLDGNLTKVYQCGFSNAASREYLTKYHLWIAFTIYSIIPFCTMLTLNSFIIRKLYLMQNLLTKRTLSMRKSNSSQQSRKSQRNTLSMTRMLLCVTFYFIIVTTPTFIFSIIQQHMFDESEITPEKLGRIELVDAVSTLLLYLNHSINFLLYAVSGRRFRRELLLLLCSRQDKYENSSVTNADPSPLLRDHSLAKSENNSVKQPLNNNSDL